MGASQPQTALEVSPRRRTVLIIDDETTFLDLCRESASTSDCNIRTAITAEEALHIIDHPSYVDLIFVSAAFCGLQLIRNIHETYPGIKLVAFTDHGVPEMAADALHEGAIDFIERPFAVADFQEKLKQWIGTDSPCSLEELRRQLSNTISPGGLVGRSHGMQRIHNLIKIVGDREFPVIILGETGTGKEVVAQAIHLSGHRKNGPFMPVDCSALTATLIESELFGHVRGAFTGAQQDRRGLFEAAHKGSLFLDEIGEIPKELQSKLLRVIQEGEVRRVGSNKGVAVDVRIIAATHRDLNQAVNEGRFRMDLYYRLNVFQMVLPPLRQRKSDIPLLVAAFLKKHANEDRRITHVSHKFWTRAMAHEWPGNVRELENMVERSMALGSGTVLTDEEENLTQEVRAGSAQRMRTERLDVLEKQTILKAMQESEGDKLTASKMLGIGKTTLYRKLKQYQQLPLGKDDRQ